MKECACRGRNPDCFMCSGFGMIKDNDSIAGIYIKNKKPKLKKGKNNKCKKLCPFCNKLVNDVTNHVSQCHPDKWVDYGKTLNGKVPIRCDICGVIVKNLAKHVRKVHEAKINEKIRLKKLASLDSILDDKRLRPKKPKARLKTLYSGKSYVD